MAVASCLLYTYESGLTLLIYPLLSNLSNYCFKISSFHQNNSVPGVGLTNTLTIWLLHWVGQEFLFPTMSAFYRIYRKTKPLLCCLLLFPNVSFWSLHSQSHLTHIYTVSRLNWGYFPTQSEDDCKWAHGILTLPPIFPPQFLFSSPSWKQMVFGCNVSARKVNSTVGLDLQFLDVWGLIQGHTLTNTYWSCVNLPNSLP